MSGISARLVGIDKPSRPFAALCKLLKTSLSIKSGMTSLTDSAVFIKVSPNSSN